MLFSLRSYNIAHSAELCKDLFKKVWAAEKISAASLLFIFYLFSSSDPGNEKFISSLRPICSL